MQRLISIEVGEKVTHIALVIKKSKDSITLLKSLSVKTPDGTFFNGEIISVEDIALLIKMKLEENNIKEKRAIFTFSSKQTIPFVRNLAKQKNEQIIKELVEQDMKDEYTTSLDDKTIGYTKTVIKKENINFEENSDGNIVETVTKGEKPKLNIAAYAVPTSIVAMYEELAKIAGLKLLYVDCIDNSIRQASKIILNEEPSMVVYIGSDFSYIYTCNGKAIINQKRIDSGYSELTSIINENITDGKLNNSEALEIIDKYKLAFELNDSQIEQVSSILNTTPDTLNNVGEMVGTHIRKIRDIIMDRYWYFNNHSSVPISSIKLICKHETYPNICSLINDSISLDKATNIKELNYIKKNKETSVSEVLSVIACIGAVIDPIDVLIQDAQEIKEHRFDVAGKVAIGLTATAIVAFSGYSVYNHMMLSSSNSELVKLNNEAVEAKAIYDEYTTSLGTYNLVNSFAELDNTKLTNLSEILDAISDVSPSSTMYNVVSITDQYITLTCDVSSKKVASILINNLESLEYFDNVAIDTISESNTDNPEALSISIICNFYGDTDTTVENTDDGTVTDDTVTDNTVTDDTTDISE